MAQERAAARTSVSFSLSGKESRRNVAIPPRALLGGDEGPLEDAPSDILLGVKHKCVSEESKKPRAIPMQAPIDWREDRKRRLGILDKHGAALGSLASMRTPHGVSTAPERAFLEPQQRGLSVRNKEATEEEVVQGDATPPADTAGPTPPHSPPHLVHGAQETSDADAIRALMRGDDSEHDGASDRVIVYPSEEDMFKRDVDTHPDAPSLEAYSDMPVEEFGAAMLRGMGWKDGHGVGKSRQGPTQAPGVKRRAALLGLGAKERALPTSDPKRRDRRHDNARYMPTGEMV
ncbi:hypothetical protein MVES_003449 [Malassezia vespertilionis]|uniref:G-patch domain-containing protein n=1 Tax=Malassezia vespertilionis TaxID=2020962 RepID=A0A2N1J843_9BASI|nr:hypothetical protein MVES_003449 [Malassezia vespertilionis]